MDRRWVLTVGIVALVALAAMGTYWILRPSPPANRNLCTGLCTALAFGRPTESTSDGFHVYNFSVQSAGGGAVWGDVNFTLEGSDGRMIEPIGAGWNITVFGLQGRAVAFYDFSSPTPNWTTGGGTLLTSVQTLQLTSPGATPLSGDTFLLAGVGGGFQGSVSVEIP